MSQPGLTWSAVLLGPTSSEDALRGLSLPIHIQSPRRTRLQGIWSLDLAFNPPFEPASQSPHGACGRGRAILARGPVRMEQGQGRSG